MLLSIVIPAKNEQENVQGLVREIQAALKDVANFEIIYIDDGSDDDTYLALTELCNKGLNNLRPIRHKTSVGQSTPVYIAVL